MSHIAEDYFDYHADPDDSDYSSYDDDGDQEEDNALKIIDESLPSMHKQLAKTRSARNGHTMRRALCRVFHAVQHEMSIARSAKSSEREPHCSRFEVPITAVDEFFDAAFVLPRPCAYYGPFRGDRLLTSKAQWTHVLQTLETHAVEKKTSFEKFSNALVTRYTLPVVGHLCFDTSAEDAVLRSIAYSERIARHAKGSKGKKKNHSNNGSNANSGWLLWNGKYHDPSFVYEYVSGPTTSCAGALRVICPLVTNRWPEDVASSAEHRRRFGGLLGSGVSTCSHNRHRCHGIALEGEKEKKEVVLEIDLKRVCDVRALVSLGKYPQDLEVFPAGKKKNLRQQSTHRGKWNKSWRKRQKRRRASVYVVRDRTALAWVESYALHFRDPVSGKWCEYGERHRGNRDVGTEEVNEVSLRARYLRITPIDVHQRPAMRVSVWGEPVTAPNARERCEKNSVLAKMVDTIQYTIYPPTQSELRMDGFTRYYRDDYGWDSPHEVRQAREKEIQYQMEENAFDSYY